MTTIESFASVDARLICKMVNDIIVSFNDYEQTKTFSVPHKMHDSTRPLETVVTVQQRYVDNV